jgi:hypothetical protein
VAPTLTTAQTDVLKVQLVGTVVVVDDMFCQCLIGVEIGGAVTGYYTYDLTANDGNQDPSIGFYEYNSLPNEIVLRVGAHEFRSNPVDPQLTVTVHDSVDSSDGPKDWLLLTDTNPYDTFQPWPIYTLYVQLTDLSATAVEGDELPTTAPILPDWPERRIDILGDSFWILASLDSVVTVVSQIESEPIPRLKPDVVCYPNPASGMATVVIGLSAASTVTADVWSVRGRRVGVLTRNRHLPAGNATLEWNGTDARGRRIPSGVYFVRVTAGGATAITRVVLVR